MAKNYMYLYGKNSVMERIKSHPESVRRVSLREGLSVPDLEKLIRLKRIDCERLPSHSLDKMRPQKDLQGVVARVDLFRYADSEELITGAFSENRSLIFLDRVNDPQNLGVIIRLSACFGRFSLVIPSREACQVNETVLHVASGGENYVPISSVNNLAPVLDAAKDAGFWVAGAVVGDEVEDISTLSFPFPLALVLGSEGGGIRKGLQKRMDIRVGIPMPGVPLSLNVGMACAIFLHEISKQMNHAR
jgi:23S rRNA (guanosine2251-2'-O)-methyltransferase